MHTELWHFSCVLCIFCLLWQVLDWFIMPYSYFCSFPASFTRLIVLLHLKFPASSIRFIGSTSDLCYYCFLKNLRILDKMGIMPCKLFNIFCLFIAFLYYLCHNVYDFDFYFVWAQRLIIYKITIVYKNVSTILRVLWLLCAHGTK